MTGLMYSGLGFSVAAGLFGGYCMAPQKFMKSYGYAQWSFVYSLLGMLVIPWILAVALCPNIFEALSQVPVGTYLKANACSLAWGAANVLCCLSLLRIGFSLTIGILTGVGLPIGMLIPMLFKGSGAFASSPSLFSAAGGVLLFVTLVMVTAVALMAYAGLKRDKALPDKSPSGFFKIGLAMAIMAGILQAGLSFAFVYSQGPLMESLMSHGASETGAGIGVWAMTLPGGALVNILFPLFLMLRKGELKDLLSTKDFLLSVLMGFFFASLLLCMGSGMRLLGALGASLGFGIYQGIQTLASQSVGFISGEWRGVDYRTKLIMAVAILLTLLGVAEMALSKNFGS